MAEGKFVAYYRVSTERQGRSGLGLEAQRTAVTDYLNGGKWHLVAEFTEVETGKGRNALDRRPQLKAAIDACRKHKATLVIAKLDRLARNVAFIAGLMDSKVDLVAVDNPNVNRMTLQILAAVAEDEARRISERTKAALQAAKARGTILGRHGREVLSKANSASAAAFAAKVAPRVKALQAKGLTIRELTNELNQAGIPTPNGGKWHVSSVHRLLQRF